MTKMVKPKDYRIKGMPEGRILRRSLSKRLESVVWWGWNKPRIKLEDTISL